MTSKLLFENNIIKEQLQDIILLSRECGIMRKISYKKGLTLIEILVSIAILGIMVVAFSKVFVQGFSNIAIMGDKTKAMATAQKVMDTAYQFGRSAINTSLIGISNKSLTTTELNTYDSTKLVKHYTESPTYSFLSGASFTKLTVKVYYHNGASSITLTSFIP